MNEQTVNLIAEALVFGLPGIVAAVFTAWLIAWECR